MPKKHVTLIFFVQQAYFSRNFHRSPKEALGFAYGRFSAGRTPLPRSIQHG